MPPLNEDESLTYGSQWHSRYMVVNDRPIAHAEDRANPLYDPAGHQAGINSNIFATSQFEAEAATVSFDQRDAWVEARRARKRADEEQMVIEEEAAIIRFILETKNQIVDAVLRMMRSQLTTQTKIISFIPSR